MATAVVQPQILLIGDNRVNGYKTTLERVYSEGIETKIMDSLCEDTSQAQMFLDSTVRRAKQKGRCLDVVVIFGFNKELIDDSQGYTRYKEWPNFSAMMTGMLSLVSAVRNASPKTQVEVTIPDFMDMARYNFQRYGAEAHGKVVSIEEEKKMRQHRREIMTRLYNLPISYMDLRYCRPIWASVTNDRVYGDGLSPNCTGVVPHLFATQLIDRCNLPDPKAPLWLISDLRSPVHCDRKHFMIKRPRESIDDKIQPLLSSKKKRTHFYRENPSQLIDHTMEEVSDKLRTMELNIEMPSIPHRDPTFNGSDVVGVSRHGTSHTFEFGAARTGLFVFGGGPQTRKLTGRRRLEDVSCDVDII